jgi:predicted kinase
MKSRKVLILSGCPASGKSTWALNYIQKNQGWVIVSRDSFRYMLKNQGFCEPNIEKLITKMVNQTVIASLVANQNVIIDNTHVKVEYINNIVSLVEHYADVDYMFFDVPLKELIHRDSQRERSVGEAVIRKMYENFEHLKSTFHYKPVKQKRFRNHIALPQSDLKPCVIFDIDGTLAHNNHRDYYDYSKVSDDLPNVTVVEQIAFQKSKGREIIILTGREGTDECVKQTREWLDFWINYVCGESIEYTLIYREKNDSRKDSVVKKELYSKFIQPMYSVVAVYDDRLSVVDMWSKMGFYVFNCNQGNHDF